MKITENKKVTNKTSLKIEGNMNIYSTAEFKTHIIPYIQKNIDLELDLSKVDKIDSAGFQMLLLLEKSIKAKEKTFTIIKISKEVESILSLYGEKFNQE